MFKLIGFFIKYTLVSLVVLVTANLVHVGGYTVSEQVKMGISKLQAAGLPEKVHDWANSQPTIPSEKGAPSKRSHSSTQSEVRPTKATANSRVQEGEEIAPSERQKLKAIIAEMNR